MINKTIREVLKPLRIPTYYMECSEKTDKYIIFNVYNEQDTDVFDNENISETYYITLNYWYSNPDDIVLYKEIKRLLKQANFKFDGSSDIKDGPYYGKNMDFIYKQFKTL